MAKQYKAAIIGLIHDHVWGDLAHWQNRPDVTLAAAADTNAPLRQRIESEFGVRATYADWKTMLDEAAPDLIHVATDNASAAEIVEAAASRGIHAVVEKPMAATLEQADRMLAASTRAGTKLLINWPTAWWPTFQEWERRISGGDIGSVTYIKYRSAHNGPKEMGCSPYFYEWLYDAQRNGAGALIDYCCYGANMAARFLGSPIEVMGMRGTFVKDYPVPDDNAIIVSKYPHAFSVAEASWTQPVGYAEGANPVAYGTEGSLAIAGDRVIWQRHGQEPEIIVPAEPQAPTRNPVEYLIHCIETGQPIEGFCSPQVSRDAQEILQAGLQSADTKQTITLPL